MKSSHLKISACLVVFGAIATLQACGGDGDSSSSGTIPLVEPPVTAATPDALAATSFTRFAKNVLTPPSSIAEIQSRFYDAGPTNITRLLTDIDDRLAEINGASGSHACLDAAAVGVDIDVFGETVTGYFQCYSVFSADSGMMFGKKGNAWYLYTNGGQQRTLAKITPVPGASKKYEVDAWMSVGQGNAADSTTCSSHWYGCSYGAIRLRANSSTGVLEISTAGTGLGFCSAHLKTDGTNLYLNGQMGQTSDGSTWSCASEANVCVATSDLTTTGTCTGLTTASSGFTIVGVSGETTLGNNITVNGATSDSIHFGPSVTQMQAITGVSEF